MWLVGLYGHDASCGRQQTRLLVNFFTSRSETAPAVLPSARNDDGSAASVLGSRVLVAVYGKRLAGQGTAFSKSRGRRQHHKV